MKPSRSATLSLGCALGAAAMLSFAGCKGLGATGGCAVEGDCGGDPTGMWQVTETCNFPVVSRPAQNYATPPYFEPETGATPPAVTSGSWCWDLTFDKDGTISSPAVPMAAPDVIEGGTITFLPNHTYVYSLTATSTTSFHVAYSCFGVNGAGLTCAQFAVKLKMSAIGANPVYGNTSGGQTPAFRCNEAGDGCDCQFDYVEADQFFDAVGDMGTWQVEGNVIHHFSSGGQGNLNEINPSRRTTRDATFCETDGGKTLQLTGTNGMALALKTGSRSLTLTRMAPPPDAGGAGGDQAGSGAGGDQAGGGAGGAGGQTDAGTD
jgi:hypothetical protein